LTAPVAPATLRARGRQESHRPRRRLAGPSAAHWLTRQSVETEVLERASEPGGLARTIERNGFRYDFGGYRFFSRSPEIQQLLQDVLAGDLVSVAASSKIFYRGRLYEYPLSPRDIYAGFGRQQAGLALWSFAGTRMTGALRRAPFESLEDWLVAEFGETLFRAFFKDYNEKVWGLPCHRLSSELASQRIRGLSLKSTVGQLLLPRRVLADPSSRYEFLYPRLGIGELTGRFAGAIQKKGTIRTDASVVEVRVKRARAETVVYHDAGGRDVEVAGTDVISSIPLPRLLYLINPRPPADVLASARSLVFRDLIAVCLELRKDRVTTDSWIYVPEPGIAFARVLEPKNWSAAMAPAERTSLVAEHYCFEGDATWNLPDTDLVERTVADLADKMRLISREDVVSGFAIRIKKPYPVYEVGYREHLIRIQRYLRSIVNLQTVGRGGMFKYYNVAHLVESGIRAAENVFGAGHDLSGVPVDAVPSGTFTE
jgi:protoporphyrinogen oxidase